MSPPSEVVSRSLPDSGQLQGLGLANRCRVRASRRAVSGANQTTENLVQPLYELPNVRQADVFTMPSSKSIYIFKQTFEEASGRPSVSKSMVRMAVSNASHILRISNWLPIRGEPLDQLEMQQSASTRHDEMARKNTQSHQMIVHYTSIQALNVGSVLDPPDHNSSCCTRSERRAPESASSVGYSIYHDSVPMLNPSCVRRLRGLSTSR